MEKKVIIEEFGREDRPRRRDDRSHRGHREPEVRVYKHRHFDEDRGPRRPEEPRKPRRPEQPREPRRPRPPKPHKHFGFRKSKTKMFTSKDELVAFVNEKGEEGHQIDIFKIEDDLYKVVVVEAPIFKEIEIEVE